MQTIIDFIKNNYEWAFSGIGVTILSAIGGMIWYRKTKRGRESKNIQIIDSESKGIQAVGSINVNSPATRRSSANSSESAIKQSITHNSSGIQSGGDVNIDSKDPKH